MFHFQFAPLMALAMASGPALAGNDDSAAIRKVIDDSYCNGAYNRLDTKAMAQGFHPEFAILGADGDAIERYPIHTWIDAIEARKAAPGFDPASALRACRIINIDVTDGAASAKVEIDRDGTLLYTDYLSLLKFAQGWKIVAKVYAEHAK